MVLPADHHLADDSEWQQAVTQGVIQAEQNHLVTFGIKATAPETAYGYIVPGAAVADSTAAYRIKQFTEKPSAAAAAALLSSGNVYWNSGIFMFKASVLLQQLQIFRPDIYLQCQKALARPQPDLDFIRLDQAEFKQCPAESIDYAVMEHTKAAVVVPIASPWSDLGSWSSLWQLSEKDQRGNVHLGQVVQHNSTNNFVYAEAGLVATVGLTDTVVIQTKDAVLVAAKDQVQQVKAIVQQLKTEGDTAYQVHRQVYRPWGNYDVIEQGRGYQVKRIRVLPGESLSLQSHQHRAEHWVVVAGTAKVTIDGTEQLLQANQSIYIPQHCVHALANPSKDVLELIEVQTGDYIDEDDIVRYQDRYGRV
ncbi:mannose-1-phosphate guanyltransferase [Alishewanella longhuensis]